MRAMFIVIIENRWTGYFIAHPTVFYSYGEAQDFINKQDKKNSKYYIK